MIMLKIISHIWRLHLMIFKGANPLLGSLEGVGPENFGARCHFRAQKSLDFLGPPPNNGSYNGFARIEIMTSSAILTIYAPVIYTRPCIMFWRRGYTLRG